MQVFSASKWYFIISVFLFSSCAKQCTESALSDVEINDPQLLIIEIDIDKSYAGEISDYENLKVWVRDKNEQALALLNGTIHANDVKLSVSRSPVAKLPFYETNNALPINDGQKYTVNVQLANGEVYTSSIDLPQQNISGIKAPSYHNRNEPLTISWNPINAAYNAEFYWEKEVLLDSSSIIKSGSFKINGTTNKVLEPSFFSDPDGRVGLVSFRIGTKYRGVVNQGFRNESYFDSEFWADATVELQDPA
ncbi:MAG: hypothetical protein ACPGLV_07600 [Bacteroidia bacterium]